jgi:ribulose-phosphate 3-epimerase
MMADSILPDQIDQFAEAGADLISVHAENAQVDAALDAIAARGLHAGIVLQLHSPVSAAAPFLDRIAMLTLLGTRIGVKGQGLDPQAEPRLGEARALIAAKTPKHRIVLAADGGIREHTVPGLRNAGAETIVMGSLAFGAADLAGRMAWVRTMPPAG